MFCTRSFLLKNGGVRSNLLGSSQLLRPYRRTFSTLSEKPTNAESANTEGGSGGVWNRRNVVIFLTTFFVTTAVIRYARDNMGKGEKAEETKKELKNALDPQKFLPFELSKKEQLTHDTSLFRFALPDQDYTLGLKVASCLVVRVPNPAPTSEKDQFVIRPYTPTSKEGQAGYFDLVVKRYPKGVASSFFHQMKEGDKLDIKGPISKYPYQSNMHKEIGMIAGGTGITPMFQVIQHILDNPNDQTKLHLLFANRSPQDIMLQGELDNLAKKHGDRFKVHYLVDKGDAQWKGPTGYINADMVSKWLPSAKQDNIMIMVCGPPPMMEMVSGKKGEKFTQGPVGGILKQLGYDESKVFKF